MLLKYLIFELDKFISVMLQLKIIIKNHCEKSINRKPCKNLIELLKMET